MAKTITLHVTVSDDDLLQGWNGDIDEFRESAKAALWEVQGDDGGAYQPEVS